MYRLSEEQQRVVEQAAAVADAVDRAARRARRSRTGVSAESIAALGEGGTARPDDPRANSAAWARGCGDGRGPGRGRAAMRLDGDGVPDAPVRRGLLRRRAGQDRDRTCGPRPRGEHLSTLAFSERGSRSHFWAPVSRAAPANGGVRLQRAEVVRHLGRPGRRLRRLDARRRRARRRSRARSTSCCATMPGLSVSGRLGRARACAATRARR